MRPPRAPPSARAHERSIVELPAALQRLNRVDCGGFAGPARCCAPSPSANSYSQLDSGRRR